MSDFDTVLKGALARAAHGCCGTAAWRGRHCEYHEGYRDGLDAAVATLVDYLRGDS